MEDRHLLISDVDNTLLGDDAALRELAGWLEARRERFCLVYNSGRFCRSIAESVRATDLPRPDALIGGVGTEIRDFKSGAPLDDWPPPNDGWDPQRVRRSLDGFADLELQPAELLSEFKISYFANGFSARRIREIGARLADEGLRVELVYSSSRDLDVLPAGVNKGTAAAHLAQRWSFARARTIVCGDSGNDLTMFQKGFRGVVVGNAHSQLRALDSPHVYQAASTYAAGVLEGLQHWLETRVTCAVAAVAR